MLLIAIVSVLIGLIGMIFLIQLYRLIKAKLNDEENRPSKTMLYSLLALIVCLGLYNTYLIIDYLNTNKEKILNAGQKAISNTIEYGTTAVFEGIGQSLDHFEEKWEDDFIIKLELIDFEVQKYEIKKIDSTSSIIEVDVIATNNHDEDWITLGDLDRNNYVLIGDKNDLFYPMYFRDSDLQRYELTIAPGKHLLEFSGQIPSNTEVKYFRILNKKWLIE